MHSDMLQKAGLLSGNMAGVTVHARMCHCFMPVIVLLVTPASPHMSATCTPCQFGP